MAVSRDRARRHLGLRPESLVLHEGHEATRDEEEAEEEVDDEARREAREARAGRWPLARGTLAAAAAAGELGPYCEALVEQVRGVGGGGLHAAQGVVGAVAGVCWRERGAWGASRLGGCCSRAASLCGGAWLCERSGCVATLDAMREPTVQLAAQNRAGPRAESGTRDRVAPAPGAKPLASATLGIRRWWRTA